MIITLTLLKGALFGLMVSLSIGPVFFALIQTGIQRGYKQGISMSIGSLLSDIGYILLSYYGLAKLINTKENQLIIGVIGGVVIILFGIYSFLRKEVKEEDADKILNNPKKHGLKYAIGHNARPIVYFLKGFFLNLLNPFVLIFWLGAVVTTNSMFANKPNYYTLVFFLGSVIILMVCNFLKVFLGKKIKGFLSPKRMNSVNKIVGIILIVCGICLIIKVCLL